MSVTPSAMPPAAAVPPVAVAHVSKPDAPPVDTSVFIGDPIKSAAPILSVENAISAARQLSQGAAPAIAIRQEAPDAPFTLSKLLQHDADAPPSKVIGPGPRTDWGVDPDATTTFERMNYNGGQTVQAIVDDPGVFAFTDGKTATLTPFDK